MISFPPILGPDGRKLVSQSLTHPAVYLDTWAIRLFAEDEPPLGERFHDAVMSVGGTLMLSHLSFAEFTYDDPRHALSAGHYLDTLIPNLFFSMFDFSKVLEAEVKRILGQTSENPAGDVDMLKLYAEGAEQRGYPSVAGWFAHMHSDRARVAASRKAMAQSVLDGVSELRRRLDTEPDFARSIPREIKNSRCHPRATHALARAVIYQLALDRKLDLTVNDAADLAHCIVPAAYCEFVLLDRGWYARLQDAQRFLKKRGLNAPIARHFTARGGGIVRFLEHLESWPRSGSQRSEGNR